MTVPYYPVRDQRGELEYREMVDEAVKIAARRKQKLPPKYHREIDGMLDRYAFHLARNFNQHFALLRFSNAGELIRKNVEEFFTIQSMLEEIVCFAGNGKSSGYKIHLKELRRRLTIECRKHEHILSVNRFYRKHNTLNGCPGLSASERGQLEKSMEAGERQCLTRNGKIVPFGYLTNMRICVKIRYYRKRIKAEEEET